MSNCCPLLSRKINILGRNETIPATAETLVGADGKIRVIAGAKPEYVAPRDQREIARESLTNLGSLESTKAIKQTWRNEANTRDTIENLANLVVATISFQSAIDCGAGSIQRYTFSGTPDLTGIVDGMYLDSNYSDKSSNDGTFKITNVDSGAYFVDVVNRVRIDNADDETTDSICDIQNPLEFQWALNSCLTEVKGISRIPIGAIAVASFARNEVATQATSLATGRVVVPAENGDAYLYFEPLTGKMVTTELITGGTSGATATSSAGPAVHGHHVKPISGENCIAEASTIDFENDGFHWEARSSMGNMTFEAAANKAMFMDFTMDGPKNSIGDQAMTTVTRDDEDPPICKTAELLLDTFSPVFSNAKFDMGNTAILRENGNAADDSGLESGRVTGRKPKFNINLEMDLAATFDFFAKLDAGTKVALQMHVGTVLDKMIWFFADYLEFDQLPIGDKDGITMLDVSADCTGLANGSNDEWEMVFI